MKKLLTIVFYVGLIFIFNNNKVQAAISFTVSCGAFTAQSPNWPEQKFKTSCTADIAGLSTTRTYIVGIYTTDYTTTKTGGNGNNITYNTLNRFKASGPVQAGIPANISTDISKTDVLKIQDSFNGVTSITFDFDLEYTTYEADCGDTAYSQPFTLGLYRPGIPDYLPLATCYGTLNFTIINKIYPFSVSGPLSKTLSVSDVFPFNSTRDVDTNTITISVKANNTWSLKTKLAGNLISGSNNIPVTSNYFRATGSGFNNQASSKTQFAVANTDYNIATNSAGVYTTGSSDGMNLSSINISVIYNVRTTSIFRPGTYTNTTTFTFTSP